MFHQPPTTGQQQTTTPSSKRVVKILGNYVLQKDKRIGQGAFSEVFKGFEKDTKEPVAIKVMPRNQLNDRLLRNLELEISVMRKVKSDYVVQLHEVQRSQTNFYLIIELCRGGELGQLLSNISTNPLLLNQYRRGLKESIARKLIYQLVTGLKSLNDQNLVHRDLKPANLLLSQPFKITTDINGMKGKIVDLTHKDVDFGFLKIADFGFAREIAPTDLAQTLCGTPLYMA